ncbi:ArsR/SmtB family transcription factor [Streptomyces sp. NPDC018019]|uniref:ArsR/SmtB family transcription factor n=1 Tax=Streptomyces sp. NPDC018019 TaxID=3365030 RepID=UPI0037BC648A
MPRQPEHPDLQDIQLARLFSALGDPARLRIMAVLADRAEHQREDFTVDVAPSTLSHHMKILREAGLTRHRFEGTRCFVSLRADTLDRFSTVLNSTLEFVATGEEESAAPPPHRRLARD